MKLSLALLGNALFASVLAAPDGLARRRDAHLRHTHPINNPSSSKKTPGNGTTTIYDYNWAGAILISPPKHEIFNAVSARFTVPSPTVPTKGSGSWYGSALVGIDGYTYQPATLRSGVDWHVVVNGSKTSTSFNAWYQWYPDFVHDFSGFEVSAGNEISVSITTNTTSEGHIIIENLTTKKKKTESISAPNEGSLLGGHNAEWVMEDFDIDGSEVPFAEFSPVTFSKCEAKTKKSTLDLGGATIIDLIKHKHIITNVSISSPSDLQVKYIQPHKANAGTVRVK